MLELGKEGRDKITGFTGILTARHQYITGCDQYTLTPPKDEKGTLSDQFQFDEGRVEIFGDGICEKDVRGKTTGGPQRSTRSAK